VGSDLELAQLECGKCHDPPVPLSPIPGDNPVHNLRPVTQ
jgi:hypothetical protein